MLITVSSLEIVRLPVYRDFRGALIPMELKQIIPFPVVRLFFISGVPEGQTRGVHAHKRCHQFLIGVAGQITVIASDGTDQRIFTLDVGAGLHIPPLIFASEKFDDVGSILAVCCDQPYDRADYIDDLERLVSFRSGLLAFTGK
jgi:UDP-2-acetamido-3-amino-2,3-dideoxy-glucuronate N-acetyltransferase